MSKVFVISAPRNFKPRVYNVNVNPLLFHAALGMLKRYILNLYHLFEQVSFVIRHSLHGLFVNFADDKEGKVVFINGKFRELGIVEHVIQRPGFTHF